MTKGQHVTIQKAHATHRSNSRYKGSEVRRSLVHLRKLTMALSKWARMRVTRWGESRRKPGLGGHCGHLLGGSLTSGVIETDKCMGFTMPRIESQRVD
jgi:hypothetical protein